MTTSRPSLAGFLTFIRTVMGIGANELPDSNPVIAMAYDVALEIVNPAICEVSGLMYSLAVYNLGGSNVAYYAQDQPGKTFFFDLRKRLKIGIFVAGVVQSTADEGSATTLAVPDSLKNLSITDLQNLRDPWGIAYLGIAQKFGQQWGLT